MYVNHLLVSYDSKNGITGLLNNIQKLKEVAPIADEVKTALDNLTGFSFTNKTASIEEYGKILGSTDATFLKFAQGIKDGSIQLKDGQTMLQGYQSHLQTTTKSLSLANLGTKALSASMKVFSTIGWMAIMTLAMKAIGKGIEVIM